MQNRLLLIICLLVISACSILPATGNNETINLQQGGITPQETVEAFLEAWNTEDYDAMYALISPRSANLYSADAFRAQYNNTMSELSFDGVTYNIEDVRLQGTSAAITYSATIESRTFGRITDEGRIMRLVAENGVWHVAWSPMDIINGMTASVRVRAERRFPPRANIYDRNGNWLVEDNGAVVAIYAREQDMSNVDDCINLMATAMVRPRSYFTRLFADFLDDSVFFVGEMTQEIFARYQNDFSAICGTGAEVPLFGSTVQSASGRTYFGHGAMAHITGYLGRVPSEGALGLNYWAGRGYAATDLVGLAGIEFAYQDQLAGAPDQVLRLTDSSGVVLRELGGATGSDPTSVTLTIDRNLQWSMAQAFNDAWNTAQPNWVTRATGGAGVVIDVNTGAVLAMFSFPTYDPRIFYPESTYFGTTTVYASAGQQITRATTPDVFMPVGPALINRAITEQTAPGSTFKIVTELAAADSGVWDNDTPFDCTLTWDGSAFGDSLDLREDWRVSLGWDAAGVINMSTALATSCNPFFWQVGGLMYQRDSSLLASYAQMLGLGASTGLRGIGQEAAGQIPVPNNSTAALNNAIGQGDTQVTVLQMARLTAAIANGGTVYRPYIVQQVGGMNGETVVSTTEPEVVRTLDVSENALAIVRQGMCATPTDEEYGTSYSVFRDAGFTSCGKTGTAQSGAVAPHSWYVTYAPADNPQIAIAVLVTNSREGSEVAAPIVRRVLDQYFNTRVADFPDWWETEYIPLEPPRGTSN